jgi:ribonuclease HI
MIDERALNIYTDGSSKQKPRRGGVGIRYIYVNDLGDEVVEDLPCPGYLGATNNEMELNACLIALRNASSYLEKRSYNKIIVNSDSNYVVANFRNAMFRWPNEKWMKRSGSPVLNANLWKELVKEIRKVGMIVNFHKVKGHSTDEHNKAVDRLAKQSSANPLNPPLTIRTVRRKQSKERTHIGSVSMLGQKITIRIIEGQYLKIHKLYRYRYEVVSKNSPFYRKVDFACSELVLREAHTYSVRMNEEVNNPRILKLFTEVEKQKSIKNHKETENKPD